MIQAAKIIGRGLAITGLIGAGVGFAWLGFMLLRIKAKVGRVLHSLVASPPKPHAFVSLQLNSGFSFNWSLFKAKLKEKCTIQNGLILLITTLFGYSLKVYASNRWGVELNDFCVYMSTYGVIGGSVKLVKSFLEGFEFVKDSNTLKMNSSGLDGNIPTQSGSGSGLGSGAGAGGPQVTDVNEYSTRRDNGTRTTGFTSQVWNIDHNHEFPDYNQTELKRPHGLILADILEYDFRVNQRSVINGRTEINKSARAFLNSHLIHYQNPNPLNYGTGIQNNKSLRNSLRNLR